MSFSRSLLTRKLLTLLEAQESIVTISQWVLFHQRHSKEAATAWAEYVKSDPDAQDSRKRLYLLYLCNDVVQQARHKRKQEFIDDFAGVLPSVLKHIYALLESSVQPKVDRLIGVWEQRHVFPDQVVAELRQAVSESTVVTSSSNKLALPLSGVTHQANSIVPDLRLLSETYTHLNRLVDVTLETLSQVGMMSKTYLSANSENLPAPREYIAKLDQLEQLCNSATTNIHESKMVRTDAIKQLDSLKANISESLQGDEGKLSIISKRLEGVKRTRAELYEMVHDSGVPQDNGDDEVPTYNSDSDNESAPKRQKVASGSPSSVDKADRKVAFSDNVEIKEFRAEEESSGISILSSAGETDDDSVYDEPTPLTQFTQHHKDDLQLKHEHDSTDEDGYTPSATESEADSGVNSNVMSLLSKLS